MLVPAPSHDHGPRAVQGVAALFALCMLAGDASAQDRVTACNGLGGVTLAPAGNDYTVTITNPYCGRGGWNNDLEVLTVEIDGFRVIVQLWNQPGRRTDTAVILPPTGWISVPPEITLEENETGSVLVTMVGLS